MVMDARWKVYVQDRRFDDNQISNMYLKLKWETVGRFSFDFRPMDGDESYMVANNTLRIFWGDLHKLDGVIQRVDWDATQWCYHIYGADIRGLLVERVNTEPATVHSYTSDIQTQVMFNGCDFPTNVWTGSGDAIGKYTFKYRVGIQNTVRVAGATRRWENVTERGTVYEHQNGCLYDATKNWVPQEYAGATLRFVSGACKNNVYNINGNTTNRVCIRRPGESAPLFTTFATDTIRIVDGKRCGLAVADWSFEETPILQYYETIGATWSFDLFLADDEKTDGIWYGFDSTYIPPTIETAAAYEGEHGGRITLPYSIHLANQVTKFGISQTFPEPFDFPAGGVINVDFWGRSTNVGLSTIEVRVYLYYAGGVVGGAYDYTYLGGGTGPFDWTRYNIVKKPPSGLVGVYKVVTAVVFTVNFKHSPYATLDIDSPCVYIEGCPGVGLSAGTIPGCSRLGDIYEIVTHKMIEVQPPSLSPATLQQDNHIVHYNLTDDQSEHTTSMTVRGTG